MIEKEIITEPIYREDENGKFHKISARSIIIKDSEMCGTLKDGRRVLYHIIQERYDEKYFIGKEGIWIIPITVAKGQAKI